MFDIEDGGQVAILEMDIADKEARLVLRRGMDAIEMIGTTGETIFARLVEIALELIVDTRSAFSCLDHDKANGRLVDESFLLELLPVDGALMMGDVNAMNLVALRITDIAIEGAPTETKGGDKEVIEEKDIEGNDCYAT